MGRYTHLDLNERRRLYQLISAGRSPRQAAAELGRHPSTIYRELKRNHRFDEEPMFRGYFPLTAHSMAAERRLRGAKISRYPELARYVVDRLEAAWSPEQIAGYLRHRTSGPLRVSHETIYQFVYGRDGQAAKLARLLPTGRRKRRRRYARKPRGLNIPPAHTIAARPPNIAERADFGHWEGDLIAFKLHHGKANLTSLVERRSRFTVLTPNSSRHSAGIMEGIERHLGTLPPSLRRTITLDRGTEFAGYGRLRERLGMTAYFCQPSAPWQKGSVENSNGRIRRFLPSDTDIAQVPRAELEQLVDRLNRTPRKCLGYRTPDEVLAEQVALVLKAEP
ncbi:IS30 family transposase [Sphingomonas sp. DT-51]|uniref:IS30 family transposase n=1 Tax=Sphingomonas sp. DT-51 TaxID=3396165 RepID=UPI003F19A3C8